MPLDSQQDLIPMDGKSSAGLIGANPGVNEVAYWNNQIKLAKKREENYRKDATRFVEIYEAERKERERTPFNILYSNTETLHPALYNETPRPIVQRRYKDADPMGKLVSQALERALEYVIDTPDATYTAFTDLMSNAVLSALVPGRGITRFNYDADIEGEDRDATRLKDADIAEDGASDTSGDIDGEHSETAELQTSGENSTSGANDAGGRAGNDLLGANGAVAQAPGIGDGQPVSAPRVAYEAVCGETCEWDRITLGYAKKWKDVPWIAFEHWMTKQDVALTFGRNWARKLKYKSVGGASGDNDDEKKNSQQDKRTEQVVVVQEIWHKSARRVLFIAEGFEFRPIKRMKDPLGLSGFYNIPEPLMLFTRVNGMVPKPLYCQYEEQAKELNDITRRIQKITNALKVRGFFDSGVGDLKQLLTQDDNVLLPAKTVGAMREGVTLESSIWLMPIDKLVVVLQQLVQQREQVKNVIYEITGIADIMRGSTVASETASAQNIKNQWGTLRLKKMQKRVQKYVKDSLRIAAEIIAKHFGEDTLAKETGLALQTSQAKQQAQQALQSMPPPAPPPAAPPGQPPPVAEGQEAPPQAGGAPPQPPPPPDPAQQQIEQQRQQLMQSAQAPSWGDVLAVMKDDLQRNYKVDIETNSTVDPEAIEDKQAMAEMMQALAQIMQQMMPAAQAGTMPMPVVKATLGGIMRRYHFGSEVEDAIAGMPDQLQPQGPDPKQLEQQQKDIASQQQQLAQKQQQVEQEAQKLQMDQQMFAQQQQMAQEMLKMKEEMAKQRIAMEQQQAEMEIEKKRLTGEHALQMKTMSDQFAVSDKLAQGEAKLAQRNSDIQTNQRIKEVETKAQGRAVETGLQPIAQLMQPVQAATQQILDSLGELHKVQGKAKKVRIRRTADGYEGESVNG